MFQKLVQKLLSLRRVSNRFDPASLNDPLALRIPWTPAHGGGANFRTHKLVEVHPQRLEFRPSLGMILFGGIFLLMGFAALILPFRVHAAGNPLALLIPALIGLVFIAVGGVMLYFGTAPIVFDRQSGFFWKGRKAPTQVFDRRQIKHFAELAHIHALQLISESCHGNESSYTSYELNLVLEDGSRINVVDHGDRARLISDAQQLSAFLNKPVWDAIQ